MRSPSGYANPSCPAACSGELLALLQGLHHIASSARGLRAELQVGRLVDWRIGDATADDPASGASWPVQRTVDAALLAQLLANAERPPRPRALRLAGARVVGQLDLEGIELVCPLLLERCWFAEPVILAEAQAPTLRLPGCYLPGLSAQQLTTRGNLELNDGFTTTEVRVLGAHVGGTLDLNGATLTNPGGPALSANRLTVDQGMRCRDGFAATGEVVLLGAKIGGQLSFGGATLRRRFAPLGLVWQDPGP